MTRLHPVQQRYLAEDLMRRRRADERRRAAAAQRQGRIDPNPHQIDAVAFALRRIAEGGCVLADEVGLGKTIEAGLVIAQLLSEGKRRVLILAPKALIGQWQVELAEHFDIESREGRVGGLEGDGVFLLGREWAGGERGSAAIAESGAFDLCVIDEAHEIFAGIHRRFDKAGKYRPDATAAVLAHRVREALQGTPMLLLTATPIQNSLAELWGLVQYVEPTGTLLGGLGTFRALFTEGDDGQLFSGQAEELRRRLSTVVRRTLRRQAEEFMEKPFVRRQARLFEYSMGAEERALYEDVTEYLLEPNLCAFRGAERRLLLLGFHRRMASSVAALRKSLVNVEERLRAMLEDDPAAAKGAMFHALKADAVDLEEDEEDSDRSITNLGDATVEAGEGDGESTEPGPARNKLEKEIDRVRSFVERASAIDEDSKAEALIRAVRLIIDRREDGDGSGKVVVFTESLTTQDHLVSVLTNELPLVAEDITIFRGTNDSARAKEALARWEEEIGAALPESKRPGPGSAVRQALIHEFRTRTAIFIATEAGAKGLNLQFCENLINYDLPWNPQRIEQRIGRVHRYGQSRDVTVVNFLARDNEAERLMFGILARKLDLFGRLLDASDAVLHEPSETAPETLSAAFGATVETTLGRIYDRARDVNEIEAELRALSDEIGADKEGFEQAIRRTRGVVESRVDPVVRRLFQGIHDDLPGALASFDADLVRLVTAYLDGLGVSHRIERTGDLVLFHIESSSADRGLAQSRILAVGDAGTRRDCEVLHLGHPVVQAAVASARDVSTDAASLVVQENDLGEGHEGRSLRGKAGRLALTRVSFTGLEPIERLVASAVVDGEALPLSSDAARGLFERPVISDESAGVGSLSGHEGSSRSAPEGSSRSASDLGSESGSESLSESLSELLEDAVEEGVFREKHTVAEEERIRFERALHQIERAMEDQALVLRQQRRRLVTRLEKARDARDNAVSSEARARAERTMADVQASMDEVDAELNRLSARKDETYRTTRELALERRYASVKTERILDVEFRIE